MNEEKPGRRILRKNDELEERVKELNCLYGVSSLLQNKDLALDSVISGVLDMIPRSWQFPESTGARILVGEKEYRTPNFQVVPLTISKDITVGGVKIGEISVCYLSDLPPEVDWPFLDEEKRLLDTISDLVAVFLEEKTIKEELKKRENGLIKRRQDDDRPEWEIIVNLLLKTDPRALLRMTRKMMYVLYRLGNEDVTHLLDPICPTAGDTESSNLCGINIPNPKRDVDALRIVHKNVFDLAEKHFSVEEITEFLQRWLKEDKARSLLIASQKRGISLADITAELDKFWKPGSGFIISREDDVTIKTALIRRFFTTRLQYINVAKRYIEIEDFVFLLKSLIGPPEGEGKLGGKASGIYLAEKILMKEMKKEDAEEVAFPRSWYITSDTILKVIHFNDLDEFVHVKYLEPREIRHEHPFLEQVFKNATFPEEIMEGLRRILKAIGDKPLIVRSSSLLEDSYGAAFSGKYKSLFLANVGPEIDRLNALIDAVAEVYASTFGPDPIEYRRERGLLDFSEEMGIIIQEVVGKPIGPYYLPAFAGVAFSNNEFTWSPRIQREDGMIRMVVGLGTRAVDRVGDDYPLIVSPNRPEIRVNSMIDETIKYSQNMMDVLNLGKGTLETIPVSTFFKNFWEEYPLLKEVVSTYKNDHIVPADTILSDMSKSDVLITFSGLIENTSFLNQMKTVLRILREKLGTPVDVEFAHDGEKLYILQCRPQSQSVEMERVPIPKNILLTKQLFSANKYVTTGHLRGIEYVVYISAEAYENLTKREDILRVASAVSDINEALPKRKFILMGPGRWGSRGDIRLGIPVIYKDINNTALLVEIAREKDGYLPDLSFGTHFFQDLVEADIKYLPLYPDEKDSVFREELLLMTENHLSRVTPRYSDLEEVIRVVKVTDITKGSNLRVIMDGETGKALAFLSDPDHSSWRMEKAKELGLRLSGKKHGVVALYVFGSTREGNASSRSDIDLLIHFRGSEQQREDLNAWLDQEGRRIENENEERTGESIKGLLDVHIITDEDIENKTSWALHIDSSYMNATEIPLKSADS